MGDPSTSGIPLTQQVTTFFVAGLGAAMAHYGLLIGLVEHAGWSPVQATLCGYLAGGVVSYALNRRFTFESVRAHRESVWRFAVVAGVGFALTAATMVVLVNGARMPYLVAQVLTTGIVLVWSFVAHKLWTFRSIGPP